jgi:hypothetical protein
VYANPFHTMSEAIKVGNSELRAREPHEARTHTTYCFYWSELDSICAERVNRRAES